MADTKITALTALTGADPANDVIPIVDVSDTTMAASGTTKKISVNNILGASGTATLASATITGDLTVDTSTLKVDSGTNNVSIGGLVNKVTGVSGSGTGLTIQASAGPTLGIWDTTDPSYFTNLAQVDANCYLYNNAAGALLFGVGNVEAMRLNSTGLGVGGAPLSGFRLNVNNGDLRVSDVQNEDGVEIGWSAGAGSGFVQVYNRTTSAFKDLVLNNAATITASGNVGIGVAPSAGKGCLQLSSGINFPATQVASSDANTLDDYVETTFSPTIVGSTTAGTATYTTQIGRATKIGRLVTFSIRVAYSAGTGIGNLRVGNLPFAAGAGSVFAVYAENIALTAGNYPVCGISSGNTFISIDQLPTGGGAATAVPYDAAGDIQISGSYIV